MGSALAGTGAAHVDAAERLHALLLRAARFEVARRHRAGVHGGPGQLDDLAVEAANDALAGVLCKLKTYRGDSRFTTWAYEYVLLEAAVKLRRHSWHGREVRLDRDRWQRLPDDSLASPVRQAETSELIDAVRDAMAEVLTPHQRAVLVALALDGVPIDVLAERRATTRGALYRPCMTAGESCERASRSTGSSPSSRSKDRPATPPDYYSRKAERRRDA